MNFKNKTQLEKMSQIVYDIRTVSQLLDYEKKQATDFMSKQRLTNIQDIVYDAYVKAVSIVAILEQDEFNK